MLGRYAGEVYVEGVPLDEIAARGLRAKVRCGGERVPPVEELAAFVRGCRARRLVFKATAGLHHAYPTAEDATHALEKVHERNEQLDEEDARWRG